MSRRVLLTVLPLCGSVLLFFACGDTPEITKSATGDEPGSGGANTGGAATTSSTSSTTGSGGSIIIVTGGNNGTGGNGSGCSTDGECPPGQICDGNACVPGCTPDHDCQPGYTCCSGTCHDLLTDVENCNQCGYPCPQGPHVTATCNNGQCELSDCEQGWYDCDLLTGCEQNQQCVCTPGSTNSCYPGPAGTEGVGECKAGTETCKPTGMGYYICSGYTIPYPEICNNNKDEDCNGVNDDVLDLDGDGWTMCENDCCEEAGANCADPTLVNPGAFEFVGNQVDDDCDPNTLDSTPAPDCSTAADFSVTPNELAQAIDLCQFTTASPPLDQKKWGVVSAELVLADGSTPNSTELSNMQNYQGAVLTDYGTGGVVPTYGPTMIGLSSGRMRDQNDPDYINPNGGAGLGSYRNPPAAYLAAHGGALPASLGCNGSCPSGNGANDSINLRLNIRVPTNALSFSYDLRFFSSEYWTYACTSFNDFYLALLTSNAAGLPVDKNISFDSNNNPLSVNNGFFECCVPKGCYTCPNGTGDLQGTGMEVNNTGGATVWLVTTAPVVPGETMTLELMVFDVTDDILDSLTLIDNFAWSVQASGVGTEPI